MGVSEDPPGVTYWKVDNGIRLTGMPSFKHILSTEEMWQVSLLLAAAGKPLPVSAQQVIDDVKPNATLSSTPPPSHGSEPNKDKP
jgi:mono/diheme cytochrome c family protein